MLSLPREAVAVARSLVRAPLALERRMCLLVDRARAHVQLHQEDEATRLLVESERMAPGCLRGFGVARDTVADLLPRAPRALAPDLRALALKVGIQ